MDTGNHFLIRICESVQKFKQQQIVCKSGYQSSIVYNSSRCNVCNIKGSWLLRDYNIKTFHETRRENVFCDFCQKLGHIQKGTKNGTHASHVCGDDDKDRQKYTFHFLYQENLSE